MEDINSQNITKKNLEEAIKKQFGENTNFYINDNKDGSFTIKFNESDRIYYVKGSGEIIKDSNIKKIKNATDLKNFRDDVNKGNTYEGQYVCLVNDITLNINEEWEPIGIYPNDSPSPDSPNNIPFKGTFDGCGYEINGIFINSNEKVKALFSFIENATIKNLKIGNNCKISGYLGTAGVVGYAYNQSIIHNCSNYANISGNTSTGGIVGILVNSTITNSYNVASISGNNNIGGIAGYVTSNSNISNCYNTGEINGNENYIGGISGYTYINSTIATSYNSGVVTGKRNSRWNNWIHSYRITDK